MHLVIELGGVVRCLFSEELELSALGRPAIVRASYVEPDQQGRWLADLAPVGGPILGPFLRRSQALAAEQVWLEAHWLGLPPGQPLAQRVATQSSPSCSRNP
jgi:hypothetical protein